MDQDTTIDELKDKVRKFCEARDWGQFHNAKDLAVHLVLESSEVLEKFRYKSLEEVEALFKDKEKRGEIEDEIADVLIMLLTLSEKYGVDITEAVGRKMVKNAKKYPVEKFKGVKKKYDEC